MLAAVWVKESESWVRGCIEDVWRMCFNFMTFWLSAYHLTCVSAQLEPTVWTHMPRSSHCIIYPRHPSNICDALESSVLFSLCWHTWKLNTPESFAVALYYCCTSTCWFWVYLASRFNIHARFLFFSSQNDFYCSSHISLYYFPWSHRVWTHAGPLLAIRVLSA